MFALVEGSTLSQSPTMGVLALCKLGEICVYLVQGLSKLLAFIVIRTNFQNAKEYLVLRSV